MAMGRLILRSWIFCDPASRVHVIWHFQRSEMRPSQDEAQIQIAIRHSQIELSHFFTFPINHSPMCD
jgi:hypothetical protein